MSNADQSPRSIDILQASHVEPEQAHIVFDIAKLSFYFHQAFGAMP